MRYIILINSILISSSLFSEKLNFSLYMCLQYPKEKGEGGGEHNIVVQRKFVRPLLLVEQE